MDAKLVIDFLTELSENNYKEWFDAHKSRYLEAKAVMDEFTADMIEGVRSFDDTIGPLQAKDCTYRIYRDLRFSKDKTPYKRHMGFYINRGGKKSGYSGYYFHLGAQSVGNVVALGDIWCPPDVLKVLREDIQLGGGDFRQIIANADTSLKLDFEYALKKVPAPYPKDTPDSEFYKLKYFCLVSEPSYKFVTGKNFKAKLLDVFRSAKPFIDYINRAIDYCREEKAEYLGNY